MEAGLTNTSFNPEASAFSLVDGSASAVKATMLRKYGDLPSIRLRISCVASMPSITGIWRSMNIISGSSAIHAWMASSPFVEVTTSCPSFSMSFWATNKIHGVVIHTSTLARSMTLLTIHGFSLGFLSCLNCAIWELELSVNLEPMPSVLWTGGPMEGGKSFDDGETEPVP